MHFILERYLVARRTGCHHIPAWEYVMKFYRSHETEHRYAFPSAWGRFRWRTLRRT